MRPIFLQNRLLVVVLLGLLLGTSCSDSGVTGGAGDVLVVSKNGGGDFDNIQEAVDAARSGDLIQVRSGSYVERVVVDKTLTIVGDGPGSLVDADGVPLLPNSLPSDSAVLVIRDAFDVVVEGLTFSGSEDGIIVRDSSDITLDNVNASGNGGNGVDIRSSVNVTVSGTFADNGDHGVRVREESSQIVLEDGTMTGNVDDGIRVRDSSDVVVRNNNSSQNGDNGIEVRDSTGIEILDNTANDNAGFGIRVRDSEALVENNTTVGNQEGDFIEE
jgi:parallel beta-helix repeat protein